MPERRSRLLDPVPVSSPCLQKANKGQSRAIERLKKKMFENEFWLLLNSPAIPFRIHNRNGKVRGGWRGRELEDKEGWRGWGRAGQGRMSPSPAASTSFFPELPIPAVLRL